MAKYRLGIYANAAPPADSSHPLSAPVLYRHRSFINTGLSPSPKPFRRIERQSSTTPGVFTTELGQPCDHRNALRALKAAAKKPGCLQRSSCTPRGALACLSHAVGWRAAQGGLGVLQFAQASRSLEAFMVPSRPMCLVRRRSGSATLSLEKRWSRGETDHGTTSTRHRNIRLTSNIAQSGWRDLNSRRLGNQTSAACPRTSPDV